MSEWQLIETAPKDGTAVLLWLLDEGFAVKAIWRRWDGVGEKMWWIPEMDFYQTDEGCHQITHWMPLPEPPSPENGEAA